MTPGSFHCFAKAAVLSVSDFNLGGVVGHIKNHQKTISLDSKNISIPKWFLKLEV